jgi:murein DD-endopeptidase MepM/ murein hydrolase activator NlpD
MGGTLTDVDPPWSWPLEPEPRVTRHFLPPPEPWKAGHRGVDLAAGTGVEVRSPADGTVTFVGMVAGRPVLSIGHAGGLLSSFEPVTSALTKGTKVQRGQAVGTIAGPPHCPFPCIHWGVRLSGTYVNPLAYVTNRGPSVLLPLSDRSE